MFKETLLADTFYMHIYHQLVRLIDRQGVFHMFAESSAEII